VDFIHVVAALSANSLKKRLDDYMADMEWTTHKAQLHVRHQM